MSELAEFRRAKDGFLATHPESPLTPEQRARFTGLAYFPEEPSLRIEAVLDTDVDREEEIVMQTTTGGTQAYHRAGKVRFEVDGEPAAITLYESEMQHELFVPFRDATSGKETYGAGRYLLMLGSWAGTFQHVATRCRRWADAEAGSGTRGSARGRSPERFVSRQLGASR